MSKKLGRPTKLTPKVVRTICKAIADGLPLTYAASVAGISFETLCQWRRLFPDFLEATTAAQAKGIHTRLKRINKSAAEGNPKSDIWYLERMIPEFSASREAEPFEQSTAGTGITVHDEPPRTKQPIPESVFPRGQLRVSVLRYCALKQTMEQKELESKGTIDYAI